MPSDLTAAGRPVCLNQGCLPLGTRACVRYLLTGWSTPNLAPAPSVSAPLIERQTDALDQRIAEEAADVLRRHPFMTTGALIVALIRSGSFTAETDPGRRKQLERALTSDAAAALGIRRVEGQFRPSGSSRGRPARVAWLLDRNNDRGRSFGQARTFGLLSWLTKRLSLWSS